MPWWPSKPKTKKGSGKARGQHNPASEDTFGTVFNDDRGAGARTDRGAAAATTTGARAAGSAAGTAHAGGRRTPRGGRDGGGSGFKSPSRQRGRGKLHGGGGGGGQASRASGGHTFTVTGVDQWGPFNQAASGGRRWQGGGGAWAGGGGRFDEGFVRTTEGMVLFWKEPACFVQWTPCTFEVKGVTYCNAEQWMMASKAKLFNDSEIYRQIMATSDPREQKALGRKVRGFDAALWDKQGYDVVVEGNLAKFRQNPPFRDELLATGDRILAEASPYDSEWGIGLHASDANALVQARWPGKNKLGEALMEVRRKLRAEAYGGGQDSDSDSDSDDDDDDDEEEEDNCAAGWTGEDWVMAERGSDGEGKTSGRKSGGRAGK